MGTGEHGGQGGVTYGSGIGAEGLGWEDTSQGGVAQG